ncbi:MAG: lectin-like protein [Coprococcus sp.]
MKKNGIIFSIILALGLSVAGLGSGIKTNAATTSAQEAKEFGGHYYQLVTTKTKYGQAELKSELQGGHLVTITSQAEQDFVYSLTGGSNIWIGADYQNGKWSWVTGESFKYTNWREKQPSNPSKEHYAQFWSGWGVKGEWDDCTDRENMYVIEWENKTAYETKKSNILNKKTYNGHSYRYVSGSFTWKEAYQYCKKMGGHLVTVTSNGENRFAYSLTTRQQDCWIGMNDAKTMGKYKWVTGERTDYRYFGKEVNHNYSGTERYMGYFTTKSGYGKRWNDFKNDAANMAFICEWEDKNPVILTTVKSKITVKKGKTTQLQYQITPRKTKVTFKSSDRKVAVVNSKGVIKGVKKGTAKITVKAGSKKCVVQVTVK